MEPARAVSAIDEDVRFFFIVLGLSFKTIKNEVQFNHIFLK